MTTAVVYSRSPRTLWRLAPDRVLVRTVDEGDGATHDLIGAAALVWIALDEPCTCAALVARIHDAELEVEPAAVEEAIAALLDVRLVTPG